MVETARGLLLHAVEIDGARVLSYRIIAPTEWNFHAQGAAMRGLASIAASRREGWRHIADLFRSFGDSPPPVGLYHRVLRDLEVPLIAATLSVTRGNQIKAAEILGLNRNTLRKKIRDLDLRGVRGFK